MATTRSFSDLLNDYLPNEMLFEELVKRDYFLNTVQKDQSWKGGTIKVPFEGAGASSVKFGGLTADTDVAEEQYPVGTVTDYVEVWGTMVFNSRDLKEHNGKIPETTFLVELPKRVNRFEEYMKQVVSIALLSGASFATVTDATNAATGVMIVDKIDRFKIGQKCALDDDNSSAASYYVTAINVNTKAVTLSATRGGSAADVSAYSVAQNAKFYHDGLSAAGGSFTSLKSALLSAANGGSSTIHGISKLAWPHLQAVNVDGTDIDASNILDELFDAYTEVRQKAKGNANTFLMSYKHLGSIMKLLQAQHGPFKQVGDTKVTEYGWTEITVNCVKGALKIVGVQEMEDDFIPMIDWSSMTFRSNGGMKKEKDPNGNEFYTVRSTNGYKYLIDISLFGEMTYELIGQNGIIYNVAY
jgi:hypothetical protein